MPKDRFEDALQKLEKIVAKLEEGDLTLEDSLKCFEEGIRLSRFCNQKLEEAEKKVQILLRDKDGTLKPEPFDPSAGSGQVTSTSSGLAPPANSGQPPTKGSGQVPLTGSGQVPPASSDRLLEEPEEPE